MTAMNDASRKRGRLVAALVIRVPAGAFVYGTGMADPVSDFIRGGKWKEGYDASTDMLDEYAKKHNLQGQDWREGYWDN